MTEEITLDTVMSRRFELVEQIAIIQGRQKMELEPLNEEAKLCELFIKDAMLTAGMQQCKTGAGMAFFTTKTSCTVSDWDATLAYIKEHDAFELLNHAVNKSTVAEYIEENKEAPPGVKFDSFKDLSWRRGRA